MPSFTARILRPVAYNELEKTTKHFHQQKVDFLYNMGDHNIIKDFLSKFHKERLMEQIRQVSALISVSPMIPVHVSRTHYCKNYYTTRN